MGKLSDLDLQIKELRSCGETIIEIANTLAGMFSSQAAEDAPPKEKPKALTLEEVRHRMTVIAQAGHSAEVKALITKYGARKLSDIDHGVFIQQVQEIFRQDQIIPVDRCFVGINHRSALTARTS